MEQLQVFYIFGDQTRGYTAYLFRSDIIEITKNTYKTKKPNILDKEKEFVVTEEWIHWFFKNYGLFPPEEKEKIQNGSNVEFWLGCYPDKDFPEYNVSKLREERICLIGKIASAWHYGFIVVAFVVLLFLSFLLFSYVIDKMPNKPF